MIKLYIEGHGAKTPMSEIIHAFTNEKVEITADRYDADVISKYDGQKITTLIKVAGEYVGAENFVKTSSLRNEKQSLGDAAKLGYYALASKTFGKTLPWGIITGIRPMKLIEQFEQIGKLTEFKERFKVSDKKIALSLMTLENQQTIKSQADENSVCVYIGIPFCPTRCLYCSFVSMPMSKQQKLVEPYTDCLIKEIEVTANLLKSAGKKVEALYIGGGTPSSLDEILFDRVVSSAGKLFDSSNLKEFTIEAGRADTITEGKIRAAISAGVTRLCVNPQTLNDEILEKIGRNHSAEDFEKAFNLARKLGVNNINTDIIAGLPGETEEMFSGSIDRLLTFNPDGVTIHTMCIKRAADLKNTEFKSYDAVKMVDDSFKKLTEKEYVPYYLYRQKDTLSCLENTGFSKPGKESFYNVFMMEDLGTVVGIGAGSVSKIKTDGANKFKRVFNFKNPVEYVTGFDEILKRKETYGL